MDIIHSNYVSVGFIFEKGVDEKRLLEGLRRALSLVPSFAGRLRLRPGGADIVCSDAGVPVSIFDVEATRNEALSDMSNPNTSFGDTVDLESLPVELRPLLTVRIYWLADGALALGCSWHHTAGDLHSFILFMQAWSAFVEGDAPPQILIVDDREAHFDRFLPLEDSSKPGYRLLTPRELELHSHLRELPDEQKRVTQIHFASEELDRMRRTFSETAKGKLSSNDVVCAHLVTSVRQLQCDGGVNISSIVSLRTRLGMPAGLIGNPLWPMVISSSSSQTPVGLAHQIREGLDDFSRLHLNIRTSRTFINETGKSWPGDYGRVLGVPGDPIFRITDWRNSGVYSISFDGQFPRFFNFLPTGLSQLPPSLGPLISIIEAPGRSGLLITLITSAALAEDLRSPAGGEMIHRFREPGDVQPTFLSAVELA
ncbi:acyltransferase (plasmid) [Streptomyces sp. NBC_01450]